MAPVRLAMNDVFHAGTALCKGAVLRKKTPLAVSWNLTFLCNQKCHYCGAWRLRYPELETAEVLSMIDDLHRLGTRWLTFSGGEPLLRKDIGKIVGYAKDKGIHVFVSTNGSMIPDKIKELRGVDKITLSLEGTAEMHDRIRGEGTFRKTEKAVEVSQDNGIAVGLQCTLTKYNLDGVQEVLRFASRFGIRAMFQPATIWLDSMTEPNPIAASVSEYRKTVDKLIQLKKNGAPIANSVNGLKHLWHWPGPAKIPCGAGKYICCIEPDGLILACHQAQVQFLKELNPREDDVLFRFKNLKAPENCAQCWCAPLVEINLILSMRPEAILNAIRTNG